MVQSWYINEHSNEDLRSERHFNPPRFLNSEQLRLNSGVTHYNLDTENYEKDGILEEIKKRHECVYFDIVENCPEKNPDCIKNLQRFYEEHLHPEEEVRFILDGSAYFDVRDKEDKWIRIKVEKGDLIILPPGVYHRFTLGYSKSIRIMRLYKHPKWTAFNRCADEHPSRQLYMERAANGFA
ncbi:1:2-dihydroxy-3-keto-5-methylthiopentene dioxygenase-like isoform X1 [Leptotrombidium deliense]|uniref:Acireductone dioxygenase n=1 Tax=Leptotrombidium deliense TaxID=299467 RepID=A0A443S1A4_9ACAR|nr:1:2-dihydroxy-3-keto-5-methylthiopentene dioxygenase-like isoform X1 [Leptotrombidium deliense]